MADASASGSEGGGGSSQEAADLLLGLRRSAAGSREVGSGQASGLDSAGAGAGHVTPGSSIEHEDDSSQCTGSSGRAWDSESDADDVEDRNSEVDQGRHDHEYSRVPMPPEPQNGAQASASAPESAAEAAEAAERKRKGKQKVDDAKTRQQQVEAAEREHRLKERHKRRQGQVDEGWCWEPGECLGKERASYESIKQL